MKKSIFIGILGVLALTTAAIAHAQTYPYSTGTIYNSQYYYGTVCPQLYSNLSRGMTDYQTGGQVSQLQQFLNSRYGQPVTGQFGPTTQANVMRFQREQGLSPVGIVGPYTRAAITRTCGISNPPYPNPYPNPYPYPYPNPYPYPYPTPIPVASTTLTALNPNSGAVGQQITIVGTGFTNDNRVHFGQGGAVHVPSYNNGTTLYLTIPSVVGPCDWAGDTSPIRCFAAGQQVMNGSYEIYIENQNGMTGKLNFTVTSTQSCTISTPQCPYGQRVIFGPRDQNGCFTAAYCSY